MSGGIVGSPDRATNAWRQRGWQHADAKRDRQPPPDPDHARAYHDGYRAGARRHQATQ